MNIYLLRHGQTEENRRGSYYGNLDVSLNAIGISQGNKANVFFNDIKLDRVYVSDKKRTTEMANLVLGQSEIQVIQDNRINETNFGDFEGKTYEEIKTLYPKECLCWQNNWMEFVPPRGESYIQLCERVKSFMEDIKKLEYDNILICTHSGVIRAIYCYVMNENIDLFWKFGCKNGDISVIKYEYGNLYIDTIMHNAYLEKR
ncbi:alpha-ribazole phosphatase [Clostridium tagluense]|uniref:alpha-ribazole phosphatase n=1 Tax=Clostridium TaxID=1485 RepID=UPI0013E9442B|nr:MULTISPECIES: alpha-ribazole phosphatase [Clostridium]MBW9157029.1 alpha-ribazole phosphatase [Clostridium tagluense]MBZ9625213.1 alpha-ribazole phosphatase [Clostridium sp. FP2]MCB2311992.1 alpha-ribazole phosphatase [Clostridium tagluense]MCB2316579.1 alpha-ribazole phosphatase [Clostridium tagluense]MCB2321485.1 alpha-ribazole phosphatase [Clostridium tagluense]